MAKNMGKPPPRGTGYLWTILGCFLPLGLSSQPNRRYIFITSGVAKKEIAKENIKAMPSFK